MSRSSSNHPDAIGDRWLGSCRHPVRVIEKSGAQLAGIKAGDTVKSIAGVDLTKSSDSLLQEVKELLAKGNASLATGEFDLLSPQNGRVIFDRFVIGEVVKPGRLLFEVSDESVVWVEAKLRPQQTSGIRVGTTARISMDGKNWVEGRVIQLHYRLDPGSRTLGVRIEVSAKNEALKNEVLHPGEYVQVALTTRASKADIAVPETAIVLLRGSPTVFKLNGDKLSPSPVITGASSGGWVEIISGVAKGNEIAVKGVSTLKSLLLKSQIGDAD